MMTMPRLALAVRQPWAWAIIHAGKDIENRSPMAVRYMSHRGPIAIIASKGMSQDEYRCAREFMAGFGVECPEPAALIRGAIIGTVVVKDVARESSSPWWMGPRGLVLEHAAPCDPIPCVGQLGFFEWKPSGGEVYAPFPWMLPKSRKITLAGAEPGAGAGDLFEVGEALRTDPDAAP